MSTPQASSAKSFRLDIQGLRGLAVLLVVLFHVKFSVPQTFEFSGGFIGVDIFFVISGFVVTGALVREIDSSGLVKWGNFFRRRARRLLPALGAAISVTMLLAFILSPIEVAQITALTGFAAALGLGNLALYLDSSDYFAEAAHLNPLLHTWSLSVEEQFYALLFVAFLFANLLGRRLRNLREYVLISILVIALLLSFGLSVIQTESNSSYAFFSPFTRAWEFLAGVLLFLLLKKVQVHRFKASAALILGSGGLAVIAYGAVYFNSGTAFPGLSALLPVLGTVSIIFAGTIHPRGLTTRILSNRLLTKLGDVSYAWYLWHWPFVVFAENVWGPNDEISLLAGAAALGPAWLSTRFLETKLSRPEVPRRKLSLIGPSVATIVALVAATALFVSERHAFTLLKESGSFMATIKENNAASEKLLQDYGPLGGHFDLVVVGDSHAGVLGGGLSVLGREQGLVVGLLSQGKGCALLSGPFTGNLGQGCQKWQQDAIEELVRMDVDTILLHAYATGRVTGFKRGKTWPFEIYTSDQQQAKSFEEALALYKQGLFASVETLSAAGKNVVIVSSIPDFTRALPTEYRQNRTSVAQVFFGANPTVTEEDIEKVPLSSAKNRNKPLFEVEKTVAATFDNVYAIDISEAVCPDRVCVQWKDGMLLFTDLDHLSSEYSYQVANDLLAQLASVGLIE